MRGLDELFLWLDAVAASTTAGPVLLVLLHADKVTRETDRRAVSDAITEVLRQPPRLIQPETVYALGLGQQPRPAGPGGQGQPQQAAKAVRGERVGQAARAAQPPASSGRAFNALQREAHKGEPQVVARIRDAWQTMSHVAYIRLAKAAMLFSSLTGPSRDATCARPDLWRTAGFASTSTFCTGQLPSICIASYNVQSQFIFHPSHRPHSSSSTAPYVCVSTPKKKPL
jgi:hypothetical protein